MSFQRNFSIIKKLLIVLLLEFYCNSALSNISYLAEKVHASIFSNPDSLKTDCEIESIDWFKNFLGLNHDCDSAMVVEQLGEPTDYIDKGKYFTLYFDVKYKSNVSVVIMRADGKIRKIGVYAGQRELASMKMRREALLEIPEIDFCASQFIGLTQVEIESIIGAPYKITDKVLDLKSGNENVRYLSYQSEDEKCKISFCISEPDDNSCFTYSVWWI